MGISILKNIFWPPNMIVRQAGAALLYKQISGWRSFPDWFYAHGLKTLPVSAGAAGMGCIGFPAHPVWEMTNECNLQCSYCHAGSGRKLDDELSTEQAKKMISRLAAVREFRMLVFTGGEPLMRNDIFELLAHSKKQGFINVVASNGTLITSALAEKLKESGVYGAAIGLDASDPVINNSLRGRYDAYHRALRGIKAISRAGMLLQINTTVMGCNIGQLGELIDLASELKSSIMLLCQFMPVGRGGGLDAGGSNYEDVNALLKLMAEKQKESALILEPVGVPQYWAYLMEKSSKNSGFWLWAAKKVFHGCTAGRGLLYIKADGDLWPCPFFEARLGNVKEDDVADVWQNNPLLKKLRDRENNLKGRCGRCKYQFICGGCRGRAYSCRGDPFEEDRLCII